MTAQRKRSKLKSVSDVPVQRKRAPAVGESPRARSMDTGLGHSQDMTLATPVAPVVFVPSKAFIVEEDHNPFKCPHHGCNKDFRKENLLAYHIKYYHSDANSDGSNSTAATTAGTATTTTASSSSLSSATATTTAVGVGTSSPHGGPMASQSLQPRSGGGGAGSSIQSPVPTPHTRKRRKKTSSICSTDSDISVSSKGKSSGKRRRHDSEISVTTASPDVVARDTWADVRPRGSQEEPATGATADTEEEEGEADVVNCVCGMRETSGLMIQYPS
ncbi:uncharacterized protein LOC106011340 [Aplysia californica]|uniref:Uncharacterized protein LOC106011340 n=1 Tax=Aplysia californica TaxID=6500 RepID=A0ABM0ZWM7_APLCA|nr:uncharacterized protein LOC106011340 [Aplysia californica]